MKKMYALLFVVLVLALPAAAGEKGTCTASADDCLAKMTAKLQNKAWLGIDYETNEHGAWVVEDVYPNSPAQKAGFEKGDVLLAVDDVTYTEDNKEKLSAVYAKLKPGSSATYWVKRQGEKVKLEATLGSVPKDVQAKWINEHMAKNHPEYQMAAK
jgi:predicted metalloprotease with PDZ domain